MICTATSAASNTKAREPETGTTSTAASRQESGSTPASPAPRSSSIRTSRGSGGFQEWASLCGDALAKVVDWRFVIHAAIILLPITVLGAYYLLGSELRTGNPIGTLDSETHYTTIPMGTYPPFLNLLNAFVTGFMPLPLWYSLYALFVCFYAPFCLLHAISGRMELPAIYVYGTILGTNAFIMGLLPQALMINLGLLVWLFPVSFPVLLVVSFFAHSLAPLVVVGALLLRLFYAPVR